MRVRIYFDIPSLTLDLTEEQVAALQDEEDFDSFYFSIEDQVMAHAETYLTVEDVITL